MKLIQIFLVVAFVAVAFLSVSAPVALADGTDPFVFTKGCGGPGQPACDAALIGPGGTATFSATFDCGSLGMSAPANDCVASEDFINVSGATITSFSFNITSVSVSGLTFSCGTGISTAFICHQDSALLFTFAGGSLCSTDMNDIAPSSAPGGFTQVPDPTGPDGDETCSGITIEMQGILGEPNLQGVKVSADVAAPEPGSGLLLLFGLMAGIVSLKYLRNI